MLAASAHFQIGRNARRQLYKLMVKEWNATLEAPGHRHVVDALYRVVDEHDLLVKLQRLLDGAAAALREEVFDKLAAVVAIVHVRRMQRLSHFLVGAVEVDFRVIVREIVRASKLRIPVVPAEDFVGALPALRHLHVLCDFGGEQIEANGIVAHHRLRHRGDGAGQGIEGGRPINTNAVMLRSELLRDQVGKSKLVAFDSTDALETDRKSYKAALPLLRKQGDQQRAVQPAREQNT